MSKGSRGGKRPGRGKGAMGMKKHGRCGKVTRNRRVLIAVASFWNNRHKWFPLNKTYESMEELMKNRH